MQRAVNGVSQLASVVPDGPSVAADGTESNDDLKRQLAEQQVLD